MVQEITSKEQIIALMDQALAAQSGIEVQTNNPRGLVQKIHQVRAAYREQNPDDSERYSSILLLRHSNDVWLVRNE